MIGVHKFYRRNCIGLVYSTLKQKVYKNITFEGNYERKLHEESEEFPMDLSGEDGSSPYSIFTFLSEWFDGLHNDFLPILLTELWCDSSKVGIIIIYVTTIVDIDLINASVSRENRIFSENSRCK